MQVAGIDISLGFLEPIISQWGYLILFLLAFLETSALIGLVVPGETVVLIAAALASRGLLDPYWVAGTVCSGAILGDSAGYLLGRRVGRGFILRHPRLFRISRRRMEKADAYFGRHGGKTIFFGRWIGFLRSLAPLLAGSARMPLSRFVAYDVAGAVSWGVTLTALGFIFGKSYSLVERWLGRVSLLLVILLVAIILLYLLARWLRRKGADLGGLAFALAETVMRWRVVTYVLRTYASQIRWILRRFSPNQAYGLGLTLGLVSSAVLVYAFGVLTSAVLARTPLVRVDGLVAAELHERAFARLTSAAEILSMLTSGWVIMALAVAVAAVLILWRRLWLDALALVTSAGGATLLAYAVKLLVQRPRPGLAEAAEASGYAFPSGHATTSTAFFMALALLATGWVRHWENRVYILLAVVTLEAAVGFSRLYLGVHYLTDVLAGYAIGAFWATVSITAVTLLARGGREVGGSHRRLEETAQTGAAEQGELGEPGDHPAGRVEPPGRFRRL